MGWSEDLAASASSSPTNGGGIYLGDTAAGTWHEQAASAGAGSSPFLAGFAADTAHLIFESPVALAPGAVSGPVTVGGDVRSLQNLYDLDHGALTLAGRVPPFPATGCDDSTHAPDCVAPAGGSFDGPYIWQGTAVSLQPTWTAVVSPMATTPSTRSRTTAPRSSSPRAAPAASTCARTRAKPSRFHLSEDQRRRPRRHRLKRPQARRLPGRHPRRRHRLLLQLRAADR